MASVATSEGRGGRSSPIIAELSNVMHYSKVVVRRKNKVQASIVTSNCFFKLCLTGINRCDGLVVGLIKYSKKYLPSDVLNKMYRGIVEPHLSYCCSVWGCCSEAKLDVLQKIQNRAARIVTSSPHDASAAPIIQNLGWSTISNLVRKETATLTYKS